MKSNFTTTREFLVWAEEAKEKLKALQDIGLDHYDKNQQEIKEWFLDTNDTMIKLDEFIKDCENKLKQL